MTDCTVSTGTISVPPSLHSSEDELLASVSQLPANWLSAGLNCTWIISPLPFEASSRVCHTYTQRPQSSTAPIILLLHFESSPLQESDQSIASFSILPNTSCSIYITARIYSVCILPPLARRLRCSLRSSRCPTRFSTATRATFRYRLR